MTLEKSKLKALMAESFAADLFKSRDAAFQETHRHKGAAEAFGKAENLLSARTQEIRKELIEKGLPFDASDPIAVGKWIVEQLMLSSNAIHKLAESAAASALRAEGQQKGIELAIDKLSNVAEEESAKVASAEKAFAEGRLTDGGDGDMLLSPGPSAPRMPGQHPGPPMKAQRQGSLPLDAPSQDPPQEPAAEGVEEKEEPAKKPSRKTAAKPKSKAAAKPRAKKTPARAKKAADAKDT